MCAPRRSRWVAVVLIAGTTLIPAPVAALPGDPPIEAIAPADGAALPVNDTGIAVTFTCPPFRAAEASPPFPATPGLLSDYDVRLSTSATTGTDGRLATSAGSGRVDQRPGTDVCDATLGSAGFPRPQATPGTYYWQAWRACSGCTGGFEVGPVRRVVLTAAGSVGLTIPARMYVGYRAAAAITFTGAGSQVALALQRRVGSAWRDIARPDNEGVAIVSLPKGSQVVRGVARIGGQEFAGPPRTVSVVPARRWATGRTSDGRYRDPARPSVRFRVVDGGRRIVGLHADVPVLCGSATSPTGLAPNVVTIDHPPVRIAPDGAFAVTGAIRGTKVSLTGRLVGRSLRGARLRVATTGCDGSIAVQARRTGA